MSFLYKKSSPLVLRFFFLYDFFLYGPKDAAVELARHRRALPHPYPGSALVLPGTAFEPPIHAVPEAAGSTARRGVHEDNDARAAQATIPPGEGCLEVVSCEGAHTHVAGHDYGQVSGS